MAVAGWLFTKIGYLKLVFFFVRQKTTAAAAATKYLIAYSKSFPFVWSLPIWVLLCCFHPFISIALAFLASYLCIFSKIFSMSWSNNAFMVWWPLQPSPSPLLPLVKTGLKTNYKHCCQTIPYSTHRTHLKTCMYAIRIQLNCCERRSHRITSSHCIPLYHISISLRRPSFHSHLAVPEYKRFFESKTLFIRGCCVSFPLESYPFRFVSVATSFSPMKQRF